MKIVIQRVTEASVHVSNEIISSIGAGLCVLVGICQSDTDKDMEYVTKKLLNLRIFENNSDGAANIKRWDKSVVDKSYEILCVSQFTLYSLTNKGNKPDFHLAMGADNSKEFYDKFITSLKDNYNEDKIKNGQFGAYMDVNIRNDGPVTIIIDSNNKEK
jgi:D-aminoacyl-tRNA deacylase